MNNIIKIAMLAFVATLASCGSESEDPTTSKHVVETPTTPETPSTPTTPLSDKVKSALTGTWEMIAIQVKMGTDSATALNAGDADNLCDRKYIKEKFGVNGLLVSPRIDLTYTGTEKVDYVSYNSTCSKVTENIQFTVEKIDATSVKVTLVTIGTSFQINLADIKETSIIGYHINDKGFTVMCYWTRH